MSQVSSSIDASRPLRLVAFGLIMTLAIVLLDPSPAAHVSAARAAAGDLSDYASSDVAAPGSVVVDDAQRLAPINLPDVVPSPSAPSPRPAVPTAQVDEALGAQVLATDISSDSATTQSGAAEPVVAPAPVAAPARILAPTPAVELPSATESAEVVSDVADSEPVVAVGPAPVVEPAPAPVVEPALAPVVAEPAPVVEPALAPVVAPAAAPAAEPAPVAASVAPPNGPAGVIGQIPGSVWRWLDTYGWRIGWRQGPGPGRLAEAQYSTSTIVIWYDTARSDAFWVGAVAHELGHAVSYVHFSNQQMNDWNQLRGLSSWRWVPGTPNDFSVGEGDFAEAFMSYLLGHQIRSIGGPLSAQDRAWIAANTPF